MLPKTALSLIVASVIAIFSCARYSHSATPSLKVSATAPSYMEREMKFWKWFSDTQAKAFESRTKDRPWAVPVTAWLEKALRAFREAAVPDQGFALLEESRTLAAECDDLLFSCLRYELERAVGGDESQESLRLKYLVTDALDYRINANQPPSLRFHCLQIGVKTETDGNTRCTPALAAEQLAHSLIAGDYPDDGGAMLAFQCNRESGTWMDAKGLETLRNGLAGKKTLPDWINLLFEAEAEIGSGWEARGTGYADSVSEEGWKVFHRHMERAQPLLSKAHSLRPECPEAAAAMLIVIKAGHGPPGETALTWLERALAACPDDPNSIGQYIDILRPKWGGSRGALIGFAAACARTGRMETLLGNAVTEAIEAAAEESLVDKDGLKKTPEISRLLFKIAQDRAKSPALKNQRQARLSDVVVLAREQGNIAEAVKALGAMDGPLSRSAQVELASMELDRPRLDLELLALSSSAGPQLEPLKMLRRRGRPQEASAGYARLLQTLPGTPPQPRQFIELCKAQATFEAALGAGEWLPAPARQDMLMWVTRAGSWKAGANGLPQAIGNGGPARIVFGAGLPEDYEFELELEREGSLEKMKQVGIAVNYGYSKRGDIWKGASFARRPDWNEFGLAYNDQFSPGQQITYTPLPGKFRFTGSFKQRVFKCAINGTEVENAFRLQPPFPQYNRFAVSCAGLMPGETIRITSLKFRQSQP